MFVAYCILLWISKCLALDGTLDGEDDATSFLQLHMDASRASATYSSEIGLEQKLVKAQTFCENNMWLTLKTCVQPFDDNTTYVVTGDIDAMWIRDSSAQMHPYIVMAQREEQSGRASKLRPLLEGTLRRQAKFMLTDPYANAFTKDWDSATDERLARGGYVFTGNYELDSGAYFFRFLAHLGKAFPDTAVLHEQPIKDATRMLIALYRQEQQHAAGKSEYRYPKWEPWELLGREGRGLRVGYTGMVWGAFRPSDDRQMLGYNVPGNLFLAATLEPLVHIAKFTWKDQKLSHSIQKLRDSIIKGVHKFGTKRREDGALVYCYEVDGLGKCKLEDDANVPSLLSLPYLDPSAKTYDRKIYKATRKFILSPEDPWFFQGAAGRGIGSLHTGPSNIWPLALVMQAMTAETTHEENEMLGILDRSGMLESGLTESFNADEASLVTREWFGWPNSLLSEFMLSRDRCQPSISEIDQVFPETRHAPRRPSWRDDETFYSADPASMRRTGVTLPSPEFFP